MLARIVMFFCFLLYGAPFLLIAAVQKNGNTPIPFWSGGEDKLRDTVTDCKGYNAEMARLYRQYGGLIVIAAICALINPLVGMILFGAGCTVGIYLVYKRYKMILAKYRFLKNGKEAL